MEKVHCKGDHTRAMFRLCQACAVCSVLVQVMITPSSQVGAMITCDAPSVTRGNPANITCYFNEDVRLSKKNVKVQRRPLDAVGFDPDSLDTVTECYWQDAEHFKCTVADGYKLQSKIGTMATIGIPKTSDAFVGKYMCELVPSEPKDIKECEFQVKDPAALNIQLSLPDFQEELESIYSTATAALVIAVLIVLVLIGLIMYRYKDRILRMLRRRARKKETESESPRFLGRSDTDVEGSSNSMKVEDQKLERIVKTVLKMYQELSGASTSSDHEGREPQTPVSKALKHSEKKGGKHNRQDQRNIEADQPLNQQSDTEHSEATNSPGHQRPKRDCSLQ